MGSRGKCCEECTYWGSYELRLREANKRGISPKLRSLLREFARAGRHLHETNLAFAVNRKEQEDVR